MKIDYTVTSNSYTAKSILENLPDPFSIDFEVSSKYSDLEKIEMTKNLDNKNISREDKRLLKQAINSTGLSHPSLTDLICVSLGESSCKAYVINLQNQCVKSIVFNYIISTNKLQIYHNSCYDLGLVYYYTKKYPKNWIDTQLLAKCLLNNVDNSKSLTGLKHLEGNEYGDWGLAKDNFKKEEMNKDYFLRYAATDACATYRLYEELMESIQ